MTSSVELPNELRRGTSSRERLLALGISLATALLVIAPFFWLGNASGHDFGFHAASWLDVAGQWKEGIFFPRWTEWANYGFGEPRFIFYPPLSWMLGAALGFVFPWNAVPGIFIVIAQTVAGLCSFALARRFLPVRAALFGAGFFAVAFAAVWLSNAPAGVLASYSVAIIFAWAAVGEKSLRPLWRGAGGLALGFGLTSFYLLPAAYEQRWVNIAQALSSGLQPSDNFLYTMVNDPEHNVFNWIASSVAILLVVMTGIAGIAAHRKAAQAAETRETRKLWRVLLLLSAAATILMIRSSAVFWEHLPKLRFVQFPWRWMAVLAVPYAYFLAAAVARRRMLWIWGAAVIVVIGGTAIFLVRSAWWDSEDIPVLQEAIANDQGFEGTDEYDPAGDDHYNLPEKAPRVQILPADDSEASAPKAEVRIARWTAEEKDLRVISSEPLRVGLRLLNYTAWRVEANGKAVTPQHAETNGQMILLLSAGTQRITARFVRTLDRKLGIAVSLVAMLTLLALLNAGGLRLLSASP